MTMLIKSCVIEHAYRIPGISIGWGQGYIGVPEQHPWFDVGYADIHVDVHGGLTYSCVCPPGRTPDGYWWFGFGTNHFGDNEHNCNRRFVLQETEKLRQQAIKAAKVKASQVACWR